MVSNPIPDPPDRAALRSRSWPCRATLSLPTPEATSALAQRIAPGLKPGDTLLLQGDLGSGKTHFARALIRAALGDDAAEVPSPSFTLVQSYDTRLGDIWHSDLYRLGDPGEIDELGLWEAFDTAICLVEWPDRLGPDWPDGAVCLELSMTSGDAAPGVRIFRLRAAPDTPLADRLAPMLQP